MKKLILIALFGLIYNVGNSQKVYAWWDAGVRLGYGLTGMVNTNIFDDKQYEHHLGSGYSLGGKFGLFFGLYNGITFDANLGTYKQSFDYTRALQSYDHSITWKTLDLALLYRNQRNGIYVEMGPQLSLVNSVKQEDGFAPEQKDVKQYYEKNYISGVFGIGGYILNHENFTTMLGFRMGYGITDMINKDGQAANFPNPSAEAQPYSSYKGTHAAFVQLNIEFNFALGYYGRSACSKRASLFSF